MRGRRIILIALSLILLTPAALYPTGRRPDVPYSLSDLVRQECMAEVWETKVLQAIHGTGYRMEWRGDQLWFYRGGEWCRYTIRENLIPKGWRDEKADV